MSIVVRVPSQSSTGVKINSQNQQKVKTQTPIASSRLSSLIDVSVIDTSNNSIVVYNSFTEKYEVKAFPIIFGGTF